MNRIIAVNFSFFFLLQQYNKFPGYTLHAPGSKNVCDEPGRDQDPPSSHPQGICETGYRTDNICHYGINIISADTISVNHGYLSTCLSNRNEQRSCNVLFLPGKQVVVTVRSEFDQVLTQFYDVLYVGRYIRVKCKTSASAER